MKQKYYYFMMQWIWSSSTPAPVKMRFFVLLFCQQKPITTVKSCSSKVILYGMYFQMNNNINPLLSTSTGLLLHRVCIQKCAINCWAMLLHVNTFWCQHWLMLFTISIHLNSVDSFDPFFVCKNLHQYCDNHVCLYVSPSWKMKK